MKRSIALATIVLFSGCASTVTRTEVSKQPIPNVTYTRQVPGVVEYVYEEPMIDVIEIPPGLNAEGTVYRPAHEEIVEIRQGHWQYYKQGENR